MAQKMTVEMVDDLDGGEAGQTVPFALDGVEYEIDLSDANASGLRDELSRFIAGGRRTGGRKIRLAVGQSAVASAPDRERSREVRAWARANGYGVSERGRIPSDVVTAFDEAQQAPAAVEPVEAPRKRAPRKKVAAATKG